MAKTLIFRNATTTGLASVVGTLAELWVDTTLKTVVVMDGVTSGGTTLARNADVQTLSSVTATNLATVSSTSFTNFTTLSSNTTSSIAFLSSVAATRATSSTFGIMRTDGTSLLAVAGLVIPAVSSNGFGARTISTGDPSGGNDGDIWYKYV